MCRYETIFSETYFNNPENKKALEHYPLIGDGKDGKSIA